MYAEAEPTDHLGANLDILREDRGAAVPDFTSRVRELVVVLSSSGVSFYLRAPDAAVSGAAWLLGIDLARPPNPPPPFEAI